MADNLPIECPKPLRQAFLDVLRWTLIYIRAEATDVRLSVAYADHAHNIPDLLKEFQPERLRYYWEVERECFLRALQQIGRHLPAPFEEPWSVIESEYRRLCRPDDCKASGATTAGTSPTGISPPQ
jgi:hypothetical protein